MVWGELVKKRRAGYPEEGLKAESGREKLRGSSNKRKVKK